MLAPHLLSAAALVAGALVLGATAASAQVKITGKEPSLANHGTYQPSLNDLPSPPEFAAPETAAPNAAAPKAVAPSAYCNSFACIPDSASGPDETITIHGQYDLPPSRAARIGRRPTLEALSRK
jgi:hypothetical protein